MCNAWNHPSWCDCGFGGAHYHATGDTLFAYGKTQAWRTDEYCVKTSCPKCQKTVFFIRYNGGSVWVDHLGRPWPKHPCFANDQPDIDPFQLLMFDPPAENPVLGIVVLATVDPTSTRLHMEVKLETGEIASIEFDIAGSVDDLNGSLIFVYLKSRQVLLGPLGTLRATRLIFGSDAVPNIVPQPNSTLSSDHSFEPSGHVHEPSTQEEEESKSPLKKYGLNWTDAELAQWERKISQDVLQAVASTQDLTEANQKARRLASDTIGRLPRPLRNRLRHLFETAKWRQVLRRRSPDS